MDFTESRERADEANNKITESLWQSKTKAIMVVNGGSIISIMTFLGQLLGKHDGIHHGMKSLIWAIIVYLIGLSLVIFELQFRELAFDKMVASRHNGENRFDRLVYISSFISVLAFPIGSVVAVVGFFKLVTNS